MDRNIPRVRGLLGCQACPMHKGDVAWPWIPSTPRYKQKRAGEPGLRAGQPQTHQTDHDTVDSGQMSGTLATCLRQRCPQSRRRAKRDHWSDHRHLTYERRLKELSLLILPKQRQTGDTTAFNRYISLRKGFITWCLQQQGLDAMVLVSFSTSVPCADWWEPRLRKAQT